MAVEASYLVIIMSGVARVKESPPKESGIMLLSAKCGYFPYDLLWFLIQDIRYSPTYIGVSSIRIKMTGV